jgi:hypothetical protein
MNGSFFDSTNELSERYGNLRMGGGYLCPEPNIMLWFAYPSHFPQAEKEMCKAEQTVHIDTCPAALWVPVWH